MIPPEFAWLAHISPPLPEVAGYFALGVVTTLALFAQRRRREEALHKKLRDLSAAHARLLLEDQQRIRVKTPKWLRRPPRYKGPPGFGKDVETVRVFRKGEG